VLVQVVPVVVQAVPVAAQVVPALVRAADLEEERVVAQVAAAVEAAAK
jgi:hypothetical protein